MSLLANYTLDNINKFWKLYPSYPTLKPYKKLFKEDKSKNKGNSSKIMWGICLLYENCEENPYRRIPEKERKNIISEELLEEPNFDWGTVTEILSFFKKSNMSQTEVAILDMENKLEERTKYIMDTSYNEDTAEHLDKIFANSDKIFNLIDKLKEQLKKERDETFGEVKGQREESAGEKRLL